MTAPTNVQDPVVLFTQFRRPAKTGEGWATVNYTIREATDDQAVIRLSAVIAAFEANGWELANEPKPVYQQQNKQGNPAPKSANIPNDEFIATWIARVRIQYKDKKSGELKSFNKARFYSEDMTMWAEDASAEWDKPGTAKDVGILPTTPVAFKDMPENDGKSPIPQANCKHYPANMQVKVHVKEGQYGYEVVAYDVSRQQI